MNDFYPHRHCQPVSSSPISYDESSLSPPSSTNHSGDYNLTTSSFSHYTCSSIQPVNRDLTRNLSDPRLDWRRHQPYQQRPVHKMPVRLERRSPFVYRHKTRRGPSPIKLPALTSLTNRQQSHPRTPRRTRKRHHKRSDSSSSEEVQQIAITIPRSILDQNRCSDSSTRSRSDEGFCASENQPDSDFEDAKTDFMNATDKIYENLCIQQQPIQPNTLLSLPPPPPDLQRSVIEEDEPLLYGRLTALVLSNARTNPKTRCKIGETQAEIKLLLQIPAVNLNVEDDRLFSRNCALFGHQVAAQLRHVNQRSPVEFQLQVKKLHKILYGLKKRNVILGGLGRFVQRILKAI